MICCPASGLIKPSIGLARSIVMYRIVDARKANTQTTIHSLRLMMGVVKPPTKEMDKARTTNIMLMGIGIPALNKASLLMPMSNKLVKLVAILFAGPVNSGFLDCSTVLVHKAVAVFDNSSLFLLNLTSSHHNHNKRSALQDIFANLHGRHSAHCQGKNLL